MICFPFKHYIIFEERKFSLRIPERAWLVREMAGVTCFDDDSNSYVLVLVGHAENKVEGTQNSIFSCVSVLVRASSYDCLSIKEVDDSC